MPTRCCVGTALLIHLGRRQCAASEARATTLAVGGHYVVVARCSVIAANPISSRTVELRRTCSHRCILTSRNDVRARFVSDSANQSEPIARRTNEVPVTIAFDHLTEQSGFRRPVGNLLHAYPDVGNKNSIILFSVVNCRWICGVHLSAIIP